MKLLETPPDQRMLDGYELVGELARGGMASVYVARRGGVGGFNRWVAVKRLDPHFACDPNYATMVLDEARLAARIHHPNVSSILEIGGGPDRPAADGSASRGDYYMVMEYVEGCTLAQLVERVQQGGDARPLAQRVVLRIVLDVLAGLQAAHELTDDHGQPIDLVHRDCTPHNILVGVNGNTRIADFGLARASARLTKTAVGTLKGKLSYMAPEQVNDGTIDLRTDLFTVGIVLWEALTGQRLFRAENDLATLERILRAPIGRLSTFIPSISPGLEEVCSRALQRNPDRRFASAAEMADAIEAAAAATTGPDGGVAKRGEVADVVHKLFGAGLSARREQLRSKLSDCIAEERRSSPGYSEGEMPPAAGNDRPSVTTITMSYGSEGGLESANFVLDAHRAAQRRQRWTRGMLTAAAAIGLFTLAWLGATHLSRDVPGSEASTPGERDRASALAQDGTSDPAMSSDDVASDAAAHAKQVEASSDLADATPDANPTPVTGTWTAHPTRVPARLPTPSALGGAPPRATPPAPPAPREPPAGTVDPVEPGPTEATGGATSPRGGALPPNELSNPYR